MSEKVLLTGANSGFGTLITKALLAAGHSVAASMRDPGARNQTVAAELQAAGAAVVEIDVTQDESVRRGVADATQKLGGLGVVINNAGVGVSGLQEAFTAEDFQRLFDVNVFGVQRVTRAALPILREQKRGLLVFVSSLLGRITIPFYGPYNASKWALEAMAENYRVELSAFGVETAVIEPGGYPTTFMDNLIRPSDTVRQQAYGELSKAPQAMLEGFHQMLLATPAQDPQNVAQAIKDLIALPRGKRPLRTTVDAIGMGQGVDAHNQRQEELTSAIFTNMELSHMLELKA